MATASPCKRSADDVAAAFMTIAGEEVRSLTRRHRQVDESRCWDVASDAVLKLLPLAMKDDILQKFARWRIRRTLDRDLKRGRLTYGSGDGCDELQPSVGGGDSSSGDVDVMDLLQRYLTEDDIEFLLDGSQGCNGTERKRLFDIRSRLKDALLAG